ncbi:MAG: four-carbon acid sugar kinase family protein [Desulfuromonadales bacterium]|nr:four-carbon acid sugar kinase family protein [Desulfuromonadales bacterium]
MSIVLGAIADDFTGATDLANNLVRAGMRTIQIIDVPDHDFDPGDADAVVVALKSRSCPVAEAVADSKAALEWLRAAGARQFFFKYCSTFDSTDQGNIGPVADALLEALQDDFAVVCPSFPTNKRTVYQGYLFAGDRLLNESGMENHPLNPMTDADLVRVLGRQTDGRVGLLDFATLQQGSRAAIDRIQQLRNAGCRYAICDTLEDSQLEVIAAAIAEHKLVTGGSGIAQALPAEYRRLGWLQKNEDAGQLSRISGPELVISGSCSQATLGQIAHFKENHQAFALDPLSLAGGDGQVDEAIEWALPKLGGKPLLVYASAPPERVREAQRQLGVEQAGQLVEQALARIARELVNAGVRRLIVAGGETSGAVVSALAVRSLRIGHQIDPGVPWTETTVSGTNIALALKSGNFGGVDFFSRAFEVL